MGGRKVWMDGRKRGGNNCCLHILPPFFIPYYITKLPPLYFICLLKVYLCACSFLFAYPFLITKPNALQCLKVAYSVKS